MARYNWKIGGFFGFRWPCDCTEMAWALKAEAGGDVEVVVAVVEAVVDTCVPMALVAEGEGVEEVACCADECHAPVQVG